MQCCCPKRLYVHLAVLLFETFIRSPLWEALVFCVGHRQSEQCKRNTAVALGGAVLQHHLSSELPLQSVCACLCCRACHRVPARHHIMPGFLAQLPDGSRTEVDGPTTFGRGTPTALSDGFLSRQHMLLTPLQGRSDAVLLTNQGQNGEPKHLGIKRRCTLLTRPVMRPMAWGW